MPLRPCLGLPGRPCNRLSHQSRCPTCAAMHNRAANRARDARRPTTTQRGLGWEHQQQRRALIAEHEAQHGPITECPRCGRAITSRNPITGEHGQARVQGGTQVTDLMCRVCNSGLGGMLARDRRRAEP